MNDRPFTLTEPFPRRETIDVPVRPEPKRRSLKLHVILFALTLVTTTMAGAMHAGVDPFSTPWRMAAGLPFSLTLLAILLSHEFGHYLLAAWHGIPTTLPYFIPGPPFLVGTFGAFIRMQGMPRSRRALFDVGAAGPWAGMMIALPAVIIGLYLSEVRPLSPDDSIGLALGSSVLFDTLSLLVLGVDPDSATILLHPVALAGWFGFFVTFLNLLPVGQLDGGHVIYALFGRGHRTIARFFFLLILGMGFLGWEGWFVWALMLAFVLRVDHPDTTDADTPLDPARRFAAWATVGMFLLVFMPVPLSVLAPSEQPPVHFDWEAPTERWRHPPHPQQPQPHDGSMMNIRAPLDSHVLPLPPPSVVPASA